VIYEIPPVRSRQDAESIARSSLIKSKIWTKNKYL